eukprot:COSAG01_NODE_4426_length_5035_cov_3.670786_6_plen_163_part_00
MRWIGQRKKSTQAQTSSAEAPRPLPQFRARFVSRGAASRPKARWQKLKRHFGLLRRSIVDSAGIWGKVSLRQLRCYRVCVQLTTHHWLTLTCSFVGCSARPPRPARLRAQEDWQGGRGEIFAEDGGGAPSARCSKGGPSRACDEFRRGGGPRSGARGRVDAL